MKANPTCRDCGHVKSLHWRPGCNMVGCRCSKFATRPAEEEG